MLINLFKPDDVKNHFSKRRTSNLKIYNVLTARLLQAGPGERLWKDLGVLGRNKKFTTVGRDFLIDAFQNITELEDMKWHDSGTGVVAESNGDTALGTPSGEARDSGTQIEDGSDTYRTVSTHTYAGTFAITEHGIFSASTVGTLLDRTVFAAINVVNLDKIEFTFDLLVAAEA